MNSVTKKTGYLLVNLGSPNSPSVQDVKSYLGEFLMDPYVIDIPFLFRWALVRGIILNIRPKRSAEAYSKIWTPDGSPLIVNSEMLFDKVKKGFSKPLALGFTYGTRSVAKGLQELKDQGCEHIQVVPLFPHYSQSTHEGIRHQVKKEAKKLSLEFDLTNHFFSFSDYHQALFENARDQLKEIKWDHLVMSYHGLPVKQLSKVDSNCAECTECPIENAPQSFCYKKQCLWTSNKLIKDLGLNKSQYSVAFQSRLGRAEWITPYTEDTVIKLARSGVKNLAVICPSFVADCLETLEEVGIGLKEVFIENGGENFYLLECLNEDTRWVEALRSFLNHLGSQES